MKNKFGVELVESTVFTQNAERQIPQSKSKTTKKRTKSASKRYTKMLESLEGEMTYGVNCQIPLSYYRRMREYKDLHKDESFQSIVLSAIMQWIDKNA